MGKNKNLPFLPMKDVVAFPGLLLPLVIKDDNSIKLIDDALAGDKHIALFSLNDKDIVQAGKEDFYAIGTEAIILKLLRFPDGSLRFLCQSLDRVKIVEFEQEEPYFSGQVKKLKEEHGNSATEEALVRMVKEQFAELMTLTGKTTEELAVAISSVYDASRLSDMIVSNLSVPNEIKQEFLSELNVETRLRKLTEVLRREINVVGLTQSIKKETSTEIEKSQKEYYLRQQLKTIQKELGLDDNNQEIEDLDKKIKEAGMPEEAEAQAYKQLDRLSKMNPASSEYSVTATYLDWLIELPWSIRTEDTIDLKLAQQILDEDHYGLEDAKDRILEYLSVLKLNPDVRSPILLLIGPPGVGKTSLGRSIARSMNRNFYRMSLGGVKDEAEIRGHRRTYVGALPGRVIQGIKSCGTVNPVFMLDEIDKIGQDFRGDPASALLEVLDPEQNFSFSDHYLEVPFDLSNVMFIATANYLDPIPRVLLDRMEMIRIPGYTRYDKLNIAKRYLIPKQLENNGLVAGERFREIVEALESKLELELFSPDAQKILDKASIKSTPDLAQANKKELLEIPGITTQIVEEIEEYLYSFNLQLGTDVERYLEDSLLKSGKPLLSFTDASVYEIIDGYTREAGLRNLERTISSVCRKVARRIVIQEIETERLTKRNVGEYLGPVKFMPDEVRKIDTPGVSIGLAWTQVGGRVLLIEAIKMPGHGNLKLTGSLGKVMQESANTAFSYIRSQADHLKIKDDFDSVDIHIHVPEGATPKDGPSAGITMATALASLFTGRTFKSNLAMTGEITLRGDVMPIGGLKEKSLAAHRIGLNTVIIPKDNEKDIQEIPKQIREEIAFIPVATMKEVLQKALQ